MNLDLIDHSKYRRNRILIYVYGGLLVLLVGSVFGGRFGGESLFERYDAPTYLYVFGVILMIVVVVFLLNSLFGDKLRVGELIITTDKIEVIDRKKDIVYDIKELSDIEATPDYLNRISDDKMSWYLDFKYRNKKYRYSFLLGVNEKDKMDELIDELQNTLN